MTSQIKATLALLIAIQLPLKSALPSAPRPVSGPYRMSLLGQMDPRSRPPARPSGRNQLGNESFDMRISQMGPDGDLDFGAFDSAVAYNSLNEEYLVVWFGDDDSGDLANDEFEVYGQRLDAQGREVGEDDFRISHAGSDGDPNFAALAPQVAFNSQDGEYLVVWIRFDDGSLMGRLAAQRLDAQGGRLGEELLLTEAVVLLSAGHRFALLDATPSVAYDPIQNRYLVLSQELREVDAGVVQKVIAARVLDSAGSLIHVEVIASEGVDSPQVVFNPLQGEYLAVWAVRGVQIRARRLDEMGRPVAEDFLVGAGTPPPGLNFPILVDFPSAAYNSAANEYLVSWIEGLSRLEGQRISALGEEVGANDFQIAEFGLLGDVPVTCADPVNGQYWALWQDGGLFSNILAQRISQEGQLLGLGAIQINGQRAGPRVAAAPSCSANSSSGDILVAWEENEDLDFNRAVADFEIYVRLVAPSALFTHQLQFPHFGHGDGLRSEFVLTNPSASKPLLGRILFTDAAGSLIHASALGAAADDIDPEGGLGFSIPALGAFRFQTTGSGGLLQGSAVVESDGPASGVVRLEIEGFGVAGVPAAQPMRAAAAPVQLLDSGIRSAIALRNSGRVDTPYNISLIDRDGRQAASSLSAFELLPNQRSARFLDELFPEFGSTEFKGALAIDINGRSSQGRSPFSAVSVEMGSQPGQLTTLPVTPDPLTFSLAGLPGIPGFESNQAVLSPDGGYLAFASGSSSDQLFLRVIGSGRVFPLSLSPQKEDGDQESSSPSISQGGSWTAFQSAASNLVADDTNQVSDIFVFELASREVSRVSTTASGQEADGESTHPAISQDGRWVAFASTASNLDPRDVNGPLRDVFVKDLQSGQVEIVSLRGDGSGASQASGRPSISGDGRWVAFESEEALLAEDQNGTTDIYLYDRQQGQLERASFAASGAELDRASLEPDLSQDGRWLVHRIVSESSSRILLRDLEAGSSSVVPTPFILLAGRFADGFDPVVSEHGHYVAYRSIQQSFFPQFSRSVIQVYSRIEDKLVTLDETGMLEEGFAGSFRPSISSDGRRIAFESDIESLVDGSPTSKPQAYLADLGAGEQLIHLAQFGNGQGLRSEIVLTNPSNLHFATAQLSLFDSLGQPRSLEGFNLVSTAPVEVSLQTIQVTLAPRQSVRLLTDGQGDQVLASALIQADGPVGAAIRFEIDGIGIAGIGVSEPFEKALVPVQRDPSGLNTALAIRNPDPLQAAEVLLRLLSSDGRQVFGGEASINLPPNGRSASFIDEIFPLADSQSFQGSVLIESDTPVASLALELGQPGQLTALPVAQVLQ